MGNLKFYDSYRKAKKDNLQDEYKNNYSEIIKSTFYNAPNVFFDIEIEKTYGRSDFEAIQEGVRVDSILDYTTGEYLGDDFKRFIFQPNFEVPELGHKFRWNNNYWLVINTNNFGSISKSVEVRRCNNVLRYLDNNGNRIIEPCIMDFMLRFTRNNETTLITSGNNEQKFWCQRNNNTDLIKANQRFLFGTPQNRVCFRVYSGGTRNYLNSVTDNDNSSSLSEFFIEHYEINSEKDDLLNGFADAFSNKFEIKINTINDKYLLNSNYNLVANLFKNGEIINDSISWTSSNKEIATIDNNGNLSTLSEGTVTLKAYMNDNIDVFDTIDINISAVVEDVYEIIINPNDYGVLEESEVEYSCYLFKNGVQQNNTFEFIDESIEIPLNYYKVNIIDANHFKIKNNKMFMDKPVMIKCKSGDYVKVINILLKGIF